MALGFIVMGEMVEVAALIDLKLMPVLLSIQGGPALVLQ